MDKHALDPACLLGDRLQTLSRAELTALAEALCRILAERGTYHGGIRPDNISRAADGTLYYQADADSTPVAVTADTYQASSSWYTAE